MSNQATSIPAAHQARRVGLPEGAPRVRITAGVGSASQKTWNLRRPVAMVGSRRTALVHLSNPEVSKAHCLIVNTGSDVLLRDLASRTGTFCDERQVELEPLRDGAVVRVGPTTIQVAVQGCAEGNEDTETGYQYNDPTKLPGSVFLVDSQGRKYQIERSVAVIGRRGNCDVPIDSDEVSLAHAAIFHVAGRPVLYDLGSRNGTFINGQQVSIAHIGQGDVLRIDDTEFTVEGPPLVEGAEGQAGDDQAQADSGNAEETNDEQPQDQADEFDIEDAAEPSDSAPQTPEQDADTDEDKADPEDHQNADPPVEQSPPEHRARGNEPDVSAEAADQAVMDAPHQRPPRPDRGHATESLSNLQTKIFGLQENILNWWDQLTDWQNRLEENTRVLKEQAAGLDERDRQAAEREQAVQSEQQRLEQHQKQLEETRQQLDGCQQELNSRQEKLDAKHKELHDKEQEVESRQQQLQEQHDQIEARKAEIEQKKGEVDDLRQQLEASQNEVQQARAELEQAQARIDDERRQLNEQLEQLTSKQKEHEALIEQISQREADLQQREESLQQRTDALEKNEEVVQAEQAVFSQFQQAINQANDAFQQSLTQRIATMQSLMENARSAQQAVEHAQVDQNASETRHDQAPQGEQPGAETQDGGLPEPEHSAEAGEPQDTPGDNHAEGKDNSEPADRKSESEAAAPRKRPPTARPIHGRTVSMDLEPEIADKLRTLRRLTNGRKSDDELLAQIRSEAVEAGADGQHKKRRWWGS